MSDNLYALWSDASAYRYCPRDQVMTHAAGVREIATSQWRDSFNGRTKYACRIDFTDGAHAEMLTWSLVERDEFAAEFQLRQRATA